MNSERREQLGRRVREVWVAWAKEQPAPKESWLVPWEELDEPSREVDRRIGAAIWGDAVSEMLEYVAKAALYDVILEKQHAEGGG